MKTPESPYIGPRPFEAQDRHKFYGRTKEVRDLLASVVAYKTVLLYAQSGAGKTSLLRAAVVPALQDRGYDVLPIARVSGTPRGIHEGEVGNIYTESMVAAWRRTLPDGPACNGAGTTIARFLATYPWEANRDGGRRPRVLIIDQFEELFNAYPDMWQQRQEFVLQLREALRDDSTARLVISMREDSIAKFDPYLPSLFDGTRPARFRLERLRLPAALEAVVGPLQDTGVGFAAGVAEKLVEDLAQVHVQTERGGIAVVHGEYVEPVQLQVVCRTMWFDLPKGTEVITSEYLRQYGDVDNALRQFYDRAVRSAVATRRIKEGRIRRWFEKQLITSTGTRGTAHREGTHTGGVRNDIIDVLENLHIIRAEQRAGGRWYELTHDRLLEPIEASNREWRRKSYQLLNSLMAVLSFAAIAEAIVVLLQREISWYFYAILSATLSGTLVLLGVAWNRVLWGDLRRILAAPLQLLRELANWPGSRV